MSKPLLEIDGVSTEYDPEEGNRHYLASLPPTKAEWQRNAWNRKHEPKRHYTRDQWNRELETRPITSNQQGRIMSSFQRLGIRDRDERLTIISWLIDRHIDSTYELKQGEAGKLVSLLQQCQTADDLYAQLPDDYWDEPEASTQTLADMLVVAALIIAGIYVSIRKSPSSKDVSSPTENRAMRTLPVGTVNNGGARQPIHDENEDINDA